MIRLIASDIDGTLLQGNKKTLNPRVFDLIMELKERGIRFAAASGRQYHSLRELFEPVQDEISYIAENGALCIHDGELLSQGSIPRELGLKILDEIQAYGECDCMLSCKSKVYIDSRNPKFLAHLEEHLNYEMEIVEDLRTVSEDFLKIAIFNADGTEAMETHFKSMFQQDIKLVTSGNWWVDFLAADTNKASALSNLLAHFQIQPQDCVAFGDQYNDVEMLQFAGTSYAMSGAAPGISYYSTYVTDSVEEVLEDIVANAAIYEP